MITSRVLFHFLWMIWIWQGPPCFAFQTNQPSQRHETIQNLFPQQDPLSRREAWQQALSTATMTTTASGLLVPQSSLAAETTTATVPTVKLGNSNLEVSRTIQGHWQLAGGHGKIRESDALANMEAHYNAGITTLDTADI